MLKIEPVALGHMKGSSHALLARWIQRPSCKSAAARVVGERICKGIHRFKAAVECPFVLPNFSPDLPPTLRVTPIEGRNGSGDWVSDRDDEHLAGSVTREHRPQMNPREKEFLMSHDRELNRVACGFPDVHEDKPTAIHCARVEHFVPGRHLGALTLREVCAGRRGRRVHGAGAFELGLGGLREAVQLARVERELDDALLGGHLGRDARHVELPR